MSVQKAPADQKLPKVDGDQCRNAMIVNDVFRVDIERCGGCGRQPAFIQYNGVLIYDPTCSCDNLSGARAWSWDEFAKYLNQLKPKWWRRQLLQAVGFDV